MNTSASLILTLLIALGGAAQAPPLVSPEVHADKRVTFRVRAPMAKEVVVSGEWGGNTPMTKDERGVWSATVGPLEPDLYGYSFLVDGFRTLDPANANVKPMRSPTTSILDVPPDKPALQDFTDVPHGIVRSHWYNSKSLGRRRSLNIYTPPGYPKGLDDDQNAAARFPTLYLFHGAGDNDATWTVMGRAHLIVDNLIAQGKAKPMVIVMPDGHAAPPTLPGGATPESRASGAQAFQRDLLEDVMPFVEKNYRVIADAKSRAIVGLSMGGGQSLGIGLAHADTFAYIGGFSSAVFNPEQTIAPALTEAQGFNAKVKLVWTACGKDDSLIQNARQLSQLLKDKGITHQFHETEGAHNWRVWRKYLPEFVSLLFR